MKNPLALRHRLVWYAVAMLGVLLLAPATRPLLRTQWQMETQDYCEERDTSVERAAAATMPHDYRVQLALATDVPPLSALETASKAAPSAASKLRNERILALTRQFPNNPSVYANLLRFMTHGDVQICYGDGVAAAHGPAAPTPEALEMFEAAAQRGAELDPQNAYFPMMRAVGLSAAHRDREALNALEAASRCTQWQEYYQDDIEGRMRLQRDAYGERLSWQQMTTLYALLFPQYAQMRAVARSAVHSAAEDERAGKVAEGIAIRHALMHCGGLMRAQGTTAINSLVGIAIANIATSNPGGTDASPRPDAGKAGGEVTQQVRDQRIAARRNRYYAYLESQGQGAEAAWARAEITAEDQAKAILIEARNNPVNTGWRGIQICISWLVNLVLLFSAVVLGVLYVMSHHVRMGTPRTDWERKILPLTRAAYALPAIFCIGAWQFMSVCKGILPFTDMLDLYSSPYGERSLEEQGKLVVVQLLVFGLTLVIPVLFIGLIAAVSRRERVPIATGLGRGLRGTALPVAAALFLLYGVSLLPTAYFESMIQTDIARTACNEPLYWAEIAHKPWPGNPQPREPQ